MVVTVSKPYLTPSLQFDCMWHVTEKPRYTVHVHDCTSLFLGFIQVSTSSYHNR